MIKTPDYIGYWFPTLTTPTPCVLYVDKKNGENVSGTFSDSFGDTPFSGRIGLEELVLRREFGKQNNGHSLESVEFSTRDKGLINSLKILPIILFPIPYLIYRIVKHKEEGAYSGGCRIKAISGRVKRGMFEFHINPAISNPHIEGRPEPHLQSGEDVVLRWNGSFKGKWNQKWVTNKGVHVHHKKQVYFVPYEMIRGKLHKHYDQHFSDSTIYCANGRALITVGGSTLSSTANSAALNYLPHIVDKAVGDITLTRKHQSCRPSGISPEGLWEVIKQDCFYGNPLAVKRKARRKICQYLGDQNLIRFVGRAGPFWTYYNAPYFASDNWIVGIAEAQKPMLVFKKDIVNWHLLLHYHVEEHTSTTSNSRGDSSSHTTYSSKLVPAKSFLRIITPEGPKEIYGIRNENIALWLP